MITTRTPMTLYHFHDFYFLQALQASITAEIARNPEAQFRRAVEKLQIDIHEYTEEFTANIAYRTFVYLYAACVGESRHACKRLAERRYSPRFQQRSRQDLFAQISQFEPTTENLKAVVALFDQDWESGYGGKAWKQIADALLMYGKMPDAAWLDYVIDLEHNNGTAFNKSDSHSTIFFNVEYRYGLSTFLDYKFAKDILVQPFKDKYGDTNMLKVTPKTFTMILRYSNIFSKKMPWWVKSGNENLSDYNVVWGSEVIDVREKWLPHIDVNGNSNEPNAVEAMAYLRLETKYPQYYTRQELKKIGNQAKKNIKQVAGKFLTPSLKKEIWERIKTWYNGAKKTCKTTKAKMTYGALPFTATYQDGSLNLFIPFPYQGYGIKERGGFSIKLPVGYLTGWTPSIMTFGGCSHGHAVVQYGSVMLQINYYQLFTQNKALEALLD